MNGKLESKNSAEQKTRHQELKTLIMFRNYTKAAAKCGLETGRGHLPTSWKLLELNGIVPVPKLNLRGRPLIICNCQNMPKPSKKNHASIIVATHIQSKNDGCEPLGSLTRNRIAISQPVGLL